ncbi:hypothetical protein ACFFQW_38390 [Umezawaea endophytica]|uniref:Alpha/beta hydrolase family protein n=1 Tax=Umezawaea endophytica TaxID=1654476 RepID=A0A9X2VW78_9PSEU|nr:hypothetical protein [Umezawaea endophytica]MCS7483814.1 hypothetical protein [Umezawaea endophytica]
MADVVFVHGIGSPRQSAAGMASAWLDALNAGARTTGSPGLSKDDVVLAYYRHAFAASGSKGPDGDEVAVADLDVVERAMVESLWAAAVAQTPALSADATKAGVPLSVQEQIKRMSGWGPFADCPPSRIPLSIRQVSLYLRDTAVRERVQAVVQDAVTERTRVLVAHSLGSVVAYEMLAANPDWPVRALVTFGSPLGWSPQVFDRLTPGPCDGVGVWPGGVRVWTNVSFAGDVVALHKELSPLFAHPDGRSRVRDLPVRLTSMHAAEAYLRTAEVAGAVLAGVSGR